MTLLLDTTLPRSLDALLARSWPPGATVEAWLFEDAESRRAAERALAARGVAARLRSAYKPLLHAFLEEIDLSGVTEIVVAYPVHPAATPQRFLTEAYPLAALVGAVPLRFTAQGPHETDVPAYEVRLTDAAGNTRTLRVRAPNRRHADAFGRVILSPTGWLDDGATDERLETDYEAAFARGMAAVAGHPWGEAEPFFEELSVRIGIPARDRGLPVGEEAVSLAEALHEDLYFSLLEHFQHRTGRPPGDRHLRPGQIVPEIAIRDGAITVTVETRPLSGPDAPLPAAADGILAADGLPARLAALGGTELSATARSGRPVAGRYIAGPDRAVMIGSGQHPNEVTGPAGALAAARELAARDGAHFTISPLENPDGAALQRRLAAANPRHMHHAARYTALGDDLEYRIAPPFHETALRHAAERCSGALLHVNLHGYPAHEWTRPLSGYLPAGFETWSLPRGFFLILRHWRGWAEAAEALATAVTAQLAEDAALMALTRAQLALSARHAPPPPLRMVHGIPCLIAEDARHRVPLTLITEYPDETITGDALAAGIRAQARTAIAAYDAFQALALPEA
ncbi:peptidase M14 [Methylobacterium terricola]|uniref:Peptidase M14 n=1 Tax=Methylobacterium terricola TaxID=2583531 RepID=A0A5C4LEX7_9HYPH|nr:peptidase M14 [Methylobacterium terricola]TNC10106.1 peptidase M14 [Methylobacterium terricola]